MDEEVIPTLEAPSEIDLGACCEPTTAIRSASDLERFSKHATYKMFLAFLMNVNHAIKSLPNSADCRVSVHTERLIGALQILSNWIDEIPPIQQPMRYGNKAFRTWMQRLEEEATSIVRNVLGTEFEAATIELAPYLIASMGNKTRIDYGTGHETAFVALLCCLWRIGFFTIEDFPALVLRIFVSYMQLVRKLQTTYMLEPAGTHGVWSLDDYQFLPFYWGAAQLIDHPHIRPSSIHSRELVEEFKDEYLYLSCIAFIHKMKTGPFGEHSPILNDVSGVPAWRKVNSGLLKMYKVEVLSKFPIMQHFLLGTILPFQ